MIALREVQSSLSLFAESLTGQPVAFVVVDDHRAYWPWSGEPSEAAPVLPTELDSRTSYRALLLHQLLRQVDRPTGGAVSDFERLLFLVENHRVAAQIRLRFPGAASDLHELLQDAAVGLVDGDTNDLSASTSSAAVHLLHRHTLGVPSANADHVLQRAIKLIDQAQEPDATGATSVRVAHELMDLLNGGVAQPGRQVLPESMPDDDAEAVATDANTGVSLDGGTPSEAVDNEHVGGGQLSTELSELEHAQLGPYDTERTSRGLSLPGAPGSQTLPAKARTFVYDEWDYHRGRHRPSWCRVIEERMVGDDHDFVVDVRRRHQKLRNQVRRRMLQLPSRDLVRVHRSLDGDQLDLDAAIEAVVDRRSGAPVDDRLQIRRDRAARNIATAFLVDLSASTSSPSVTPQAPAFEDDGDPMDDPMSYGAIWDAPRTIEPVRRVIDVAKDAVALMADAVHELGDLYAVYGFSGTGRDGVEFKIGKDFGDRTSAASWAAVAAMKPLRYTRMGPAVRHAAAKLTTVTAQTKLLIVVSDGYPQDTDYGQDRNDRDYGMHDTARALRDATDQGIETFCVTIDPAGHDYLRDMCPDGRYLVIDDVESLPEELAKLYLHTIGA